VIEDASAAPDVGAGERGTPEMAIITGMSGAGRSTAAKSLEDLGWFVVDNLPPGLLPTLADLGGRARGEVPRIAAVVDVRGGSFFSDLQGALEQLSAQGSTPRILYLEASDDALVRRFESIRRPHPLQNDGRIIDGIHRERVLLRELRGEADLVVDTSTLNVHQLSAKVVRAFEESEASDTLRATVMSFGYKYGLPVDADLVVDVRFLPNPHWVPTLRPLDGLDDEVSSYVLAQEGAAEFLDSYLDVLRVVAAGYLREGKRYATIAVGCTGGKHRSVAMSQEIAQRLSTLGLDVAAVHRDLGRE
jgi:UPF0042 nucleotide-binding protein